MDKDEAAAMVSRIQQIQKRENLTPSRFADIIGIQRAAMSHIISGRNNPSLDVCMKILEKFTYVNYEWLLFDRGSMLKDSSINKEPTIFENKPEIQPNVQPSSENRPEIGVKPVQNVAYSPVIEKITPVQTISKNVSKIMIFYSDNTFDTFIPEKNKKE